MGITKIKVSGTTYDIKDSSARESISDINETLHELEGASELWYGIKWTDTNPTPVRIGNMAMHRSLPIQSKMKTCSVANGNNPVKPNGYVSDEWSGGLLGFHVQGVNNDINLRAVIYNRMVEIPEYWFDAYSETINGITTHYLKLYPVHVTGAAHSRKLYIGAYEAVTNDNVATEFQKVASDPLYSQYASVVAGSIDMPYAFTTQQRIDSSGSTFITYPNKPSSLDEGTIEGMRQYLGGNRNSTTYPNSSPNNLLGKPATNLTRAQFRERCANNGDGWSLQYWDAYMAWVRLYVVEYCSFNSQAAFNASKDADGFAQGGLGPGVSILSGTDWNNWNGYNPIVPCGVTENLYGQTGSVTGVVNYVYNKFYEDRNDGTEEKIVQVPCYRGIENPFGHIWKFTDGINIYGDSSTNKTSIYTCDDPSLFADNTSTGYTLRTSDAVYGSEGWIKNWLWDQHGDFIPLTQGGSSASYLYDYSWYQNAGWKILLSGGYADYGAPCGLFCFLAYAVSGLAWASLGGRLCYTPTE